MTGIRYVVLCTFITKCFYSQILSFICQKIYFLFQTVRRVDSKLVTITFTISKLDCTEISCHSCPCYNKLACLNYVHVISKPNTNVINYLFKLNLVTNFHSCKHQEVVIAKCICAITTSIELKGQIISEQNCGVLNFPKKQ